MQNGFRDGTSCCVIGFSWGDLFSLPSLLRMTKRQTNFGVFQKKYVKTNWSHVSFIEIVFGVTFSSFKFRTAHIGFTFVDCC